MEVMVITLQYSETEYLSHAEVGWHTDALPPPPTQPEPDQFVYHVAAPSSCTVCMSTQAHASQWLTKIMVTANWHRPSTP